MFSTILRKSGSQRGNQMKKDKFRAWAIRNPPRSPEYFAVPGPRAALWFLLGMAEADLKNDWVSANAFGLEVLSNGQWAEWEDDQGQDIGDLMDKLMDSMPRSQIRA
jgi:hypothetical protein